MSTFEIYVVYHNILLYDTYISCNVGDHHWGEDAGQSGESVGDSEDDSSVMRRQFCRIGQKARPVLKPAHRYPYDQESDGQSRLSAIHVGQSKYKQTRDKKTWNKVCIFGKQVDWLVDKMI